MSLLKNYFSRWENDSVILQHKVWFDLMIYCYRCGHEGLRELTKTLDVIKNDGTEGHYIIKQGSEVTKNHRTDQEDKLGGIIYEDPDSQTCPVKSYEFYLA